MDLEKIKLGHSPLTDTIFLYRHGKDAGLALDKREAEAEESHIRVYRMDDMEWWAGESLAACLAEARRQFGDKCYPDEQYELSDEQMQSFNFMDEDVGTCTFAEELARRIKAGETFPLPFASINA